MTKRTAKIQAAADLTPVPAKIIETVTEAVAQIVADPERPKGLPPADLEPEAPLSPVLGAAEAETPRRRNTARKSTARAKRLTGGERERVASKARERRRKKTA